MLRFLIEPWGWILIAIALIHFIRRRPNTYWLWIIIMGGWLGSLVYIFMEVVPDFSLLGDTFQHFNRGKRIKELVSLVRDNPSAGNYEELADMYFDDGKYSQAKGAMTVRSRCAPIRRTRFTGELSARSSWASFLLR